MKLRPTKTYAVLMLAILAQATGNVFLSKGMKYIASANHAIESGLLSIPFQALVTPIIWIGIAFSITFYILFTVALSWTDLSFVLPVISAEVVVNVAFADYFLGEPVSPMKWAGTVLISLGIILVLRTHSERKEIPGVQGR